MKDADSGCATGSGQPGKIIILVVFSHIIIHMAEEEEDASGRKYMAGAQDIWCFKTRGRLFGPKDC